MYRFSICITATLLSFCAVSAVAQQRPQQNRQRVSPELYKLLSDWAKSSDKIDYLHGKHTRRVYNTAFETEQISQGEFAYEKPDKGKITMNPIKIDQELIDYRNSPKARVQRKKKSRAPYDLKPARPERWLCDGEKIYDINVAAKEAKIAQLPPDQRGKNIMNTPLPFLFGMPPELALRRFDIKITRDYRADERPQPFVALEIEPRTVADRNTWVLAQIILNTNSFLPDGVRLTDPAKTKKTFYKFSDMKTERSFVARILGRNPWDPGISGYQIQLIQPDEPQAVAQGAGQPGAGVARQEQSNAKPAARVLPRLTGIRHDTAENRLIAAGIPKENISKIRDRPAPREDLTYHVSAQQPAAGTPITSSTKVVLKIFVAQQ